MVDPETTYNWRRLNDRIRHTASPPSSNSPTSTLSGCGTSSISGSTPTRKALPDEAASVARLGMTYIHIPVNFQNPTDQDFDQFCAVMEQLKDVPVQVHCIANARVSAFFYRYRRDVLGIDETQARAEMEGVWQPNAIWAAFVARRSERRDQ